MATLCEEKYLDLKDCLVQDKDLSFNHIYRRGLLSTSLSMCARTENIISVSKPTLRLTFFNTPQKAEGVLARIIES